MYKFVDTIESQGDSALPSEALSINGNYIEELIPGYRTLQVEGRELLETEISDTQVGFQSGSRYHEKRDTVRDIIVTYSLLSNSPEEFREKFNELCKILDQEQAQLIFADEPDKYFIGTKSSVGSVKPGRLNTIGNFTFTCTNPYKYAVTEKTAVNNGAATITLTNSGAVAVPISVKAVMQSDNGYLGLALDDRFYQIGNAEEVDGEDYEETVLLFDDHLYEDKGWLLNQGVTPAVTPERLQNGTAQYVLEEGDEGYVTTKSYGSGDSWHGAAVTKIVPADDNGEYPVNWAAGYRFDFNTDGASESEAGKMIGHNSVTFSDENDNVIVAIVFEDNNANYEKSDMAVYIGDTRVWTEKNTDKYYTTMRGSGPYVAVEKIGDQITVGCSYADINKTFFADNPDAQLRKITWYGAAYKTNTPIRNSVLRALQLKKHNVERYEDIPNCFAPGDEIYLDGESNKLYANNILNWDNVDIGSKPLLLPPGTHTLGIITSSWAQVPDVEVTWREGWL